MRGPKAIKGLISAPIFLILRTIYFFQFINQWKWLQNISKRGDSVLKKIPPKKTTSDLELDFEPFQFSRQSKAVVKSHRSKILSLRWWIQSRPKLAWLAGHTLSGCARLQNWKEKNKQNKNVTGWSQCLCSCCLIRMKGLVANGNLN